MHLLPVNESFLCEHNVVYLVALHPQLGPATIHRGKLMFMIITMDSLYTSGVRELTNHTYLQTLTLYPLHPHEAACLQLLLGLVR